MGRTPGELLDAVSSAELEELLAFDDLEPCGGRRDDLRAARMIVAVMAAYAGEHTPKTVADVFPLHPDERAVVEHEQEVADQMRACRMMAGFGGGG